MTTAAVLMKARRDMPLYEHDARYDNLNFEKKYQGNSKRQKDPQKEEKQAKQDHCWLCRDFIVKKPQPSFQHLAHS